FQDAYIDSLILNVYAGRGSTEVWIDDLEIGPVLDDNPPAHGSRPTAQGTKPSAQLRPPTTKVVEFTGQQLLVGSRPFLLRGIRHSDTPLKVLRDAGFNTLWVDYASPPELLKEAVDLGFWLVPALPPSATDPHLVSTDNLARDIGQFPESDAVL